MNDERQRNGVKHCSDLYRTIGGEHFIQWVSYASQERVRAYREAGVRCRRIGEELFIRNADFERARSVDEERGHAD